MIHLVSSIVANLFVEEELKLLVVGCDGAGKTSLVERLKARYNPRAAAAAAAATSVAHSGSVRGKEYTMIPRAPASGDEPAEYSGGPAAGASPATSQPSRTLPLTKPTIGLNVARLPICGRRCLLWDLGGQAPLRQLWRSYFHQCHGIILVLDSTDHAKIRESAGILRSLFLMESLRHVPILILANKCESPDALSGAALQAELRLLDLALMDRSYDDASAVVVPGPSTERAATKCETGSGGIALPQHWEERIPETLHFCSGIGTHVFRLMLASVQDDFGIVEGIEWLVGFLIANPRHVEQI